MLLSIVIPVFNEEALVATLLGKIVDLQLADGMAKEVVIVDDGSTDGTLQVLRAFHAAHPEVRLLVHEKNRGKGAAVRTGMEAAHGDILIIQDADLEYDPEDIRDPRTQRRGIDNFASFMRFLGPIARAGSTEQTRAGEQLFAAIGCATCHTPVLTTGPSSNPLFDRKPVALFSDLLLHDVGTGDGIVQGPADDTEIRTPALWGLRLRRPLLHDGSAATAEDAVRRHANEAELARRGFEQLSDADRAALLAFLRSL